ncbi:hypothetical protein FLP10_02835 [Agromyces intestinalis]|uniref:Peptidase S51 n=1 Tax=Agromyces intestinalis TaxID=2592652 RepID=A0A5C1YDH5_9MICO|nr:Type 1 glutamine amidotransferase-like domain-containing protein [Agromyces intestinalis]QEO13465.1 hypothetical protein FLP10_02835 [Agromyces intestinalis]
MSVHLVGGGTFEPTDATAPIWAGFRDEAAAHAARAGREVPRIAVITARSGDPAAQAAKIVALLDAAGPVEVRTSVIIGDGETVPPAALAEVDGVVIGGGHAPSYRAAVEPVFGELRRQVAAGVPYLGFSAGAMIAAERAIIGGRRIGGVVVSPEPGDQELDEVTIAPGIGLVDVAIEVHVAQWGALSRLVAAVEAGLVEGGLGIDEDTALVVGDGGLRVVGTGSVWRVLPGEQGVVVATMGA